MLSSGRSSPSRSCHGCHAYRPAPLYVSAKAPASAAVCRLVRGADGADSARGGPSEPPGITPMSNAVADDEPVQRESPRRRARLRELEWTELSTINLRLQAAGCSRLQECNLHSLVLLFAKQQQVTSNNLLQTGQLQTQTIDE